MNYLELFLAFLEGFALVVSPCILPILPILLSSSVDGGKSRPYGTIVGFVFSFSAFAVLSRTLLTALGIDIDIIRGASLFLLFAMGVILVSTFLSEKFGEITQGLASIANKFTPKASGKEEGFLSGVVIGALIGLVWTPCAGPILAAVIIQTVSQQSNLIGFLTIFMFALGAALPMFLMAMFGRTVIEKFDFFKKNNLLVRRIMGFAIMGGVAYTALGGPLQLPEKPAGSMSEEIKSQFSNSLVNGLQNPYTAPEIEGATAWLNSPELKVRNLRGKVILIDFWTYSCINCVRTLPYVTKWDEKYRDKGLVIIGMHAPEFEFEKKLANVKEALLKHNIKYPVALDNDFKTWRNYKNRFWPAHFLISKEGKVVYEHFGEGEYNTTENNIRFLLGLNKIGKGDDEREEAMEEVAYGRTPELYLGQDRLSNFASPEQVVPNLASRYSFPQSVPLHNWALQGEWKIEGDKAQSTQKEDSLKLHFHAGKIYAVLGTLDNQPHELSLQVDEKATSSLTVKEHTLYELASFDKPREGTIKIGLKQPGVQFYTFTFGG